MIIQTKKLFQLLRTHHKIPPSGRANDMAGRLTLIADGRIHSDPLTQRALGLFLRKRIQPSSTRDVA